MPDNLEEIFYKESKHPIYEVELLPVLVAAMLWGDTMSQCQAVFFLDNDAAKVGLIKGSGATRLASLVISQFCEREAALQRKTWFSRVPSYSNLSDGPSRMDFHLTDTMGSVRCNVPWHEVIQSVCSRPC